MVQSLMLKGLFRSQGHYRKGKKKREFPGVERLIKAFGNVLQSFKNQNRAKKKSPEDDSKRKETDKGDLRLTKLLNVEPSPATLTVPS